MATIRTKKGNPAKPPSVIPPIIPDLKPEETDLDQIEGFPILAWRACVARHVHTLGDLPARAEAIHEGTDRAALTMALEGLGVDATCRQTAADAVWRHLNVGSQIPPTPRPDEPTGGVDSFNESTPPPRRRPQGEPLPKDVIVPRGEPIEELFRSWDKAGRVPVGSVLARFVGTTVCASGLEPVGGDTVDLTPFKVLHTIRRQRGMPTHVVLVPPGEEK